jgi:hypothetical protein
MNKTIARPRRKRRRVGPLATAVLVTVGAAAAVAGVGITTASAASTSTQTVTEAFRESIKPWDSITVPSMTCPSGSWLLNKDLSPGRYVPLGVEVVEPGLIGVTITGTDYDHGYGGNKNSNPIKGTLSHVGISTATNWDPFGSRELVIKLHCTTDITKASQKTTVTYG